MTEPLIKIPEDKTRRDCTPEDKAIISELKQLTKLMEMDLDHDDIAHRMAMTPEELTEIKTALGKAHG